MKNLAPLALAAAALTVSPAHAVIIDGIDFDDSWFADVVTDYSPTQDTGPSGNDPTQALGPADVTQDTGITCFFTPTPENCKFTSLGDGGSLTVEFTDNFLNGDGTPANDLYIIEVGVAEGAEVQISVDGSPGSFVTVGNIPVGAGGSLGIFSYGFDIDASGFGITDIFNFVRLIDANAMASSNPEGSDIDAIGAIPTAIPVPAVAWLFPAGLIAGLGWMRRRSA